MKTIKLGIHGGAGRLGRRILVQALADPRFCLSAVVVREQSAADGEDAGVIAGGNAVGILAGPDLENLTDCDVVIDVSTPQAGAALALWLASLDKGPVLVTGTTGWDEAEKKTLLQAAQKTALLKSGNFSLGVTALCHAVKQCAERLGPNWGVHIHDSHHSAKKDAPSGTALMLAQAVVAGWGKAITPAVLPTGERFKGRPGFSEIIISVAREGEVVGTHHVSFYGKGEVVTLSHEAQSRDIFALGALQAACWLIQKPAGLYGMDDITA